VAAVVIAAVVVIIVLQNTRPVETRLLFVTLAMPGAVLIALAFLAGFAAGVLAAGKLTRKPPPKP